MKNSLIKIIFCITAVAAIVAGMLPIQTASAAGTSTIRIVKYAADGVTIIDERTVTIEDLEFTLKLPIYGNGTTHYYTQGPTFDPNNLWDPGKLCPGDSLKDKGALRGAALKDLCNLVGGMQPGDSVKVKASDGYGETFDYPNVYNALANQELNDRQGTMVICWEKDGQYAGNGWADGMLLAFFPNVPSESENPEVDGKYIFGHQDMHDCLPQHNWHWYYDGSIQYPSTHGLYTKWVSEISIYSGGATGWTVELAGAQDFTLTQSWFENSLACHVTEYYTDSENNTWSGLPLWYVCGVVDDDNLHGPEAFNDNLYYDVKVMATDHSYTFPSTQIARNDGIILADKVKLAGTEDFVPLPPDKYPLKLVSSEFTVGGPSVAQIYRIELNNISISPPTFPPIVETDAEWPLKLYGAQTNIVSQSYFESAVNCHGAATYTDPETNDVWSGLPLWLLAGLVDDENTHGAKAFNDGLAAQGYDIWVIAADGYYQEFDSASVARNNDIIVANKLNGQPLPVKTGVPGDMHPCYPLKIVGSGVSDGSRVGAIVRIDLRNIPSAQPSWDLNNDHICDIGDVVVLGLKWGQTGAGGWIPEDLNKDGVIDIGDVVVLGLHWNATW